MEENQISREAFQDVLANVKDCFLNLIRSCFDKTSENLFLSLRRLCKQQYADTLNAEVAYNASHILEYLKENFENMDMFPSAASFAQKFTDYKGVSPLNGRNQREIEEDITTIERFVQNAIFARKLFSLASDVRMTGITTDTLNVVQGMYEETYKGVLLPERDIIEEMHRQEESPRYRLYVDPIDRLTGGCEKGYITTIAAFAGGCKTTWALNIALHNALAGLHVVYMSFEVASDQLLAKLLSAYSKYHESPIGSQNAIPLRAFGSISYMNKTQRKHLEILEDFWEKELKNNLTLLDETDIGSTDMEANAVRQLLYKIDDKHPIDLLIIDHLTFLKYYNGQGTGAQIRDEYGKLNNYVAFFRKLATSFRIKNGKPQKLGVILLSQINRKGYESALKSDTNNKYIITSLAESNELERSSGYVLTIFKSASSDYAVIQLLKSRNGVICEEGLTTLTQLPFSVFGDTVTLSNDEFFREIHKESTCCLSNDEPQDAQEMDWNILFENEQDLFAIP